MAKTNIRIIENIEELHRLENPWNEYFAAKDGVQYFHTIEWATRNWKAVEQKGEHPFVVVAEERGAPILIWALQFEKRHGVRSVSALALDRPYYNDVMLWPGQPSQLIEQALQIVRTKFRPDFAWFDMVRPQTHVATTLAGLGARPMPVPACQVRLSAFGGFDQFYGQLRRGLRKDQRRRRRRLLEQGVVRFEVIRDYPAAADSLDWIINRKIAWLRQVGGNTKALTSGPFSDFAHNLCLDAARKNGLFVGRVTLNSNPIAADSISIFAVSISLSRNSEPESRKPPVSVTKAVPSLRKSILPPKRRKRALSSARLWIFQSPR